MDVNLLSFVGLAGIPLILSLVQLVKATLPTLPSRFLPILTLLFAEALNILLAFNLHQDVVLALLVGMVTGLSASGLYSHITVTDDPPPPPVYVPVPVATVPESKNLVGST